GTWDRNTPGSDTVNVKTPSHRLTDLTQPLTVACGTLVVDEQGSQETTLWRFLGQQTSRSPLVLRRSHVVGDPSGSIPLSNQTDITLTRINRVAIKGGSGNDTVDYNTEPSDLVVAPSLTFDGGLGTDRLFFKEPVQTGLAVYTRSEWTVTDTGVELVLIQDVVNQQPPEDRIPVSVSYHNLEGLSLTMVTGAK